MKQDMEHVKNVSLEQTEAVEKLKAAVLSGTDTGELLWSAMLAFQGYPFATSGRGGKGGLPFTYSVKKGRNGAYVGELVIDRKEKSKTITRSTIELAFQNALAVEEREGRVAGPKKLGTFGASYLYPIFLKFGVIGN